MTPLQFVFAYILDLVLGDPRGYPHPVVLIGRTISSLERGLRSTTSIPRGEKVAGVVLLVSTLLLTYFSAFLLIRLLHLVWSPSGYAITVFFAYSALSVRQLHKETVIVIKSLEKGDLHRARKDLSMVVGRDTHKLGEKDIIRALIETVAENTSDGIVAPMFYLIIGGPPLALAYKAVNTLDSMVGYKNSRYLNLGWASAKFDDIVNYIPARITGLMIVLSALILRKPWRDSWGILLRDGRKHDSPNSGIPEAASAGALGVQLGGLNFYFGKPSLKPPIGDAKNDLSILKFREMIRIMYLTSVLSTLIGSSVLFLFKWLLF